MAHVEIYSTAWCGYCRMAKMLLADKQVAYDEIDVGADPAFRQRLLALTGNWTVPQILIDGRAIGGYTELRALERTGKLDELLAA